MVSSLATRPSVKRVAPATLHTTDLVTHPWQSHHIWKIWTPVALYAKLSLARATALHAKTLSTTFLQSQAGSPSQYCLQDLPHDEQKTDKLSQLALPVLWDTNYRTGYVFRCAQRIILKGMGAA